MNSSRPDTMLGTFEAAAATASGVEPHLERFTPPNLEDLPSEPFEVVLGYSRQKVHVPADASMLDALRSALPDVPASCETGVCGTCILPVLAGRPDHRDAILHGPDRERTDIIYPCVSRTLDQRLVLDA